MAKYTTAELQKLMRKLDFCMMTTIDGRGRLQSCPMSNNNNVDYDGSSYFFSMMDTDKVKNLKKNNRVTLTFQGEDMLFIEASGKGKLLTSKIIMQKYWKPGLEMWFKKGIATKGIVLIKVDAKELRYWHKQYEGKLKV
jgi:general stress protein 26